MKPSRNKLYLFIFTACVLGFVWLYYHTNNPTQAPDIEVCYIKNLTGFACPSCGTTRSLTALIQGNIAEALHWNPLGLLAFLIMVVSPVWIIIDLVSNKNGFQKAFHWVEEKVRIPMIGIPLIVLIIANWIWNIYKGL